MAGVVGSISCYFILIIFFISHSASPAENSNSLQLQDTDNLTPESVERWERSSKNSKRRQKSKKGSKVKDDQKKDHSDKSVEVMDYSQEFKSTPEGYKMSAFAASAIAEMPLFGKFQNWRVDAKIQNFGYPSETHGVQTEDGYLLTLFRIPKGRGQSVTLHHLKKQKRIPVLLLHGFDQNSAIWFYLGNDSLPFLLADKGYDVWIGNHRGNVYSTSHISLTRHNNSYWDYGLDEMARDVPTVIDYILFETGRTKLYTVGYSFGATQILAALSARPDYNKKIGKMVALGFSTFFGHSLSQFSQIIKLLPALFKKQKQQVNDGANPPLKDGENASPGIFPTLNCLRYKFLGSSKTCRFLIKAAGFEQEEKSNNKLISFFNIKSGPNLAEYASGGVSRRMILHLLQLVKKDRLTYFDFGKEGNLKMYGKKEAPKYDMSKIKIPIIGLYANEDKMVAPQDTQRTIKVLSKFVNRKRAQVQNEKWSHHDFWMASDAKNMAYEKLIKYLDSRSKS